MGGTTLPTASTPGYTTLPAKYGPDVACVCDATWWPVFVRFLRFKGKTVPTLWQAVGDNPLSAGAHAGGGALDWSGIDSGIAMLAREAGRPDTWPRPWDNNHHTHSIATGCPHLSDAAKRQLGEVKEGDDGLAADGPDPLRPPSTYRTWSQGIAWMEKEMDVQLSDTIYNPITQKPATVADYIVSINTNAYEARNAAAAAQRDAAVARKLAEAAAAAGKPLTAAEIDDIAAAVLADLGSTYDATVTLTPKEA